MFLPCLAKTGGNCHEAVILVEELAVTLKAVGGCEGTEINIEMYNVQWYLNFYKAIQLFCWQQCTTSLQIIYSNLLYTE